MPGWGRGSKLGKVEGWKNEPGSWSYRSEDGSHWRGRTCEGPDGLNVWVNGSSSSVDSRRGSGLVCSVPILRGSR